MNTGTCFMFDLFCPNTCGHNVHPSKIIYSTYARTDPKEAVTSLWSLLKEVNGILTHVFLPFYIKSKLYLKIWWLCFIHVIWEAIRHQVIKPPCFCKTQNLVVDCIAWHGSLMTSLISINLLAEEFLSYKRTDIYFPNMNSKIQIQN